MASATAALLPPDSAFLHQRPQDLEPKGLDVFAPQVLGLNSFYNHRRHSWAQ